MKPKAVLAMLLALGLLGSSALSSPAAATYVGCGLSILYLDAYPDEPMVGDWVDFAAHVGGEGTLTYNWDFGDGTWEESWESTWHEYDDPGEYTVELTVEAECEVWDPEMNCHEDPDTGGWICDGGYRTEYDQDSAWVSINVLAPVSASPTQEPAANAAGWSNSDVTVSWHWSGGNGDFPPDPCDPDSCRATSTSEGEGQLTLGAHCTDSDYHSGWASYTVKVDKTAPVLGDCPVAGPFEPGSGSHPVGPIFAEDVPGAVLVSGLDEAASTLTGLVTTDTGGLHAVTFTAVDYAGNGDDKTCFYEVGDHTPPAIEFSVGTPSFTAGGSTFVTSATAIGVGVTDSGSGVDACGITITGPDGTQAPDCAAGDNVVTLSGSEGSYTVEVTASDVAGNPASASQVYVLDNTAPVFEACPAGDPYLLGSGNYPVSIGAGDGSGSGLDEALSDLTGSVDASTVGSKLVDFDAVDNMGNLAEQTCAYRVIYAWSGFFQPVDNRPALNSVKAGSAIPVKFSLAGDQGLGIMAAGYPKSTQIACETGVPVDPVEETVPAGQSSLSYDPDTGQYIYVWKTLSGWKNTCRQLEIQLVDGEIYRANFRFK